MADNKLAYAASTPFTISLNDLATATSRSSAFVDNETTLYVDAHVSVKFVLAAPVTPPTFGPADVQCVYVYAYGMEDGVIYGPSGGPSGSHAIDGTDKLITGLGGFVSTMWALRLCAVSVQAGAGGAAYVSPPVGVAQAFGGILPRRWGIVVNNQSKYAFTSPCSASYTGIFTTS